MFGMARSNPFSDHGQAVSASSREALFSSVEIYSVHSARRFRVGDTPPGFILVTSMEAEPAFAPHHE